MLKDRILKHNVKCWLVNTGWIGGPFGVGKRISIKHTRNLLNAVLDGKLGKVKYRKDKLFGFEVPLSCPGVPPDVMEPSNAWGSKKDYWKRYDALAARFVENFKYFSAKCSKEVINAGPKRITL
jgi:phosphoenolpyruvate carboxykinase (ATP)